MCMQLIQQFEDTTGTAFDFNGPQLQQCEFCGELMQYKKNHSCFGIEVESCFEQTVEIYLSEQQEHINQTGALAECTAHQKKRKT